MITALAVSLRENGKNGGKIRKAGNNSPGQRMRVLVCVRYRDDPQQKKRWKTVELIVEERRWDLGAKQQLDGRRVYLRVAASEVEIRRQVKGAGGKWNPR